MGKFAEAASQPGVGDRGDGFCAAGRYIKDNFDDDDLSEFVRLVPTHRWSLITRLSGGKLKRNTLIRHVHGECMCVEDAAAMGCCPCGKTL